MPFQGRAQGGRMLQAGLIHLESLPRAIPVQLQPSESLIFLPGALDLRPGAKITSPTPRERIRTAELLSRRPGWLPERPVFQDGGAGTNPGRRERIRAAGFPGWPSGSQSGGSGSLDGRPGTEKAVRERSNSIREDKNRAGNAQIGSGRLASTRPVLKSRAAR